ncbi:hypothetical protein PYW07_005679 [Mythimna separata]|uniref:Glycine N-acyltransferase-like protein n=1 Tax=Mythimna separata TaxID=271217 RepID=A0AAD8DR62_MYTSE|nr:hypothetical protein PYW07_005679 [Mythimna separata]
MSQEPLRRIPPEKWEELQSAFKKDWPRGASGYLVLAMQKQWVDRGIDHDFKVYCPFGDVQNGMVAVNEKTAFYEVIIQCPNDNLENLGKALKTTKIIDWKRSIIVPYVPYNIIELIKTILDDINVEIELVLPSARFILDTRKPYDDINLPAGMTFEVLTNKYVDLVDTTWPHRYPSSPTYFELLIDNKYGYGLSLNNTLICWLLINESGNLLHMYTVKEHRQKGYAELLLKLVSNILIEDGMPVSAYCLADNFNAIKLYNKAGFDRIEGVAWCYLRSKIN